MSQHRPFLLALVGAVVLCGVALPAAGQSIPGLDQGQGQQTSETTQQQEPQKQAEPAKPSAITPAQVPNRAEQARATLRQAMQVAEPLPQDQAIAPRLPDMANRIAAMREDPQLGHPKGMDFRALDNARQQWSGVRKTLDEWQKTLTSRSETLAQWRQTASTSIETWGLTIDALRQAKVSGALVDTAESVRESWRQADSKLKARQGEVLTVQSQLTAQVETVENMLDSIAQVQSEARVSVLRRDASPLWRGLRTDTTGEQLPTVAARLRSDVRAAIEYLADHSTAVSVHLLVTFVALGVLLAVRKRVSRLAEQREDLRRPLSILSRPVAAALAISLTLVFWIYPDAPIAFREMLSVIAVIPLVWLLPLVISPSMRQPVYIVAGLFLVLRGTGVIFSGTTAGRLVLLAYSVVAAVAAWWVFRPGGRAANVSGGPYWKGAKLMGRLAAVLFSAAALLNVLGFTAFAKLLAEGTLRSAFLGLWMLLSVAVLEGVSTAFVLSRPMRVLNMTRWNSQLILHWLFRFFSVLAAVTWGLGTLTYFRVLDPVTGMLRSVLTTSATIGSVSISLGDIIGFIVAIVVGLYLARFLRFVLTVEVFPRVTLPRGVPATIIMLINYTVLGLAFVFALAAAGIELTKFALIAGALSVGIGFGLQNVVNNFVSGLILAFERPVQAGDAVQLGDMWGRVTRIGVRSSTVRTWSGAEVIVPNGDLISNQVTNWTLSDQQRRMEIPVGVAYGTDPHKVIEIIVRCAKNCERVLQDPEPGALFLGFGASSLDFELRAWTDDFDNFLGIKSDLTLAVHDALYEAGIEIPFPQRDLHLRSVDERIAARLLGGSSQSPGGTAASGGDSDGTSASSGSASAGADSAGESSGAGGPAADPDSSGGAGEDSGGRGSG